MTERCVALLRGINVTGNNKLPMRDLTEMFGVTGCHDVQTYIQSGNVVFRADAAVIAGLGDRISGLIHERFGYRVPVVLRTAEQLGGVVRSNPFMAQGVDPATLHVLFLADQPEAERIAALDPALFAPDEFVALGCEVYLRFPNGVGRSKLTNAYFDRALRTVSTMRNWRTVTTLLGMVAS